MNLGQRELPVVTKSNKSMRSPKDDFTRVVIVKKNTFDSFHLVKLICFSCYLCQNFFSLALNLAQLCKASQSKGVIQISQSMPQDLFNACSPCNYRTVQPWPAHLHFQFISQKAFTSEKFQKGGTYAGLLVHQVPEL